MKATTVTDTHRQAEVYSEARIEQIAFHGGVLSVNHDVVTPFSWNGSRTLTAREETVSVLGAVGLSIEKTGKNLNLSEHTLKAYRSRAYQKLHGTEKDSAISIGHAVAGLAYNQVLQVIKRPTSLGPTDIPGRWAEIMQGLARGLPQHKIAAELGLSPETIKTHAKHMRRELKLLGQADAVLYGIMTGAVDLPVIFKTDDSLLSQTI